MISDSITDASATAALSARDFGKKKKTNRATKLKQSKLGLRREQWLSQVAMISKWDKESLSNSPNSVLSDINSVPDCSSSSSSSGSGGSCSGSITDEEDNDGGLDDWEAFADALAADDENHEKEYPPPESCEEHESVKQSDKQKSNQAWRPDDKLRPQGLPNLEKHCSFPVMNLHFSSVAVPSSCPICYEDLDLTDSNFLPCPCGFRLCLFCHKTICDGEGCCPGCRNPYERNTIKVETSVHGGGLTIRLARSSSILCRP
ncbi:unnamed protein product [Eruca vesicaria subsp. sativa]|uniref:RING-type domain-containing protein n=1 Tax=Eruca vesicaria subsp. sativa TaxID=29727 RepID=A0ABC8KKW1_ERUVS|nr:unnamed protein product [Eruca vesicaria subsp. sativa]